MSLFRTQHITKTFNGIFALNGLSIELDPETITGIIGPNGAGKTTLFNIISGLLPPDKGHLFFDGQDITEFKPWERAELGMGRLFQDTRVFGQLTVQENVMSAFPGQTGEQIWNNFFRTTTIREQEKKNSEKTKELLNFVGLEDKAADLAMELSYGQQKLLSIARLLAMNSRLLLLDEPTAGVNPAMIDDLLELIRELPNQGKTVVLIEHNMQVVHEIAGRAIFLHDGRVIAEGPPHEVLNNREIRKMYMGV